MQQFTLSLKASLASEAKALERKFGEALCYLPQLSPSALLQRSGIPLPFAAGKGRAGSTRPRSLQPPQVNLRTCSCVFAGVEAIVWD